MFFVLSKWLWVLASPTTMLVTLICAGCLVGLRSGWRRFGLMMTGVGAIALAAALFSPIGTLLLRTLENDFDAPTEILPAPHGIIVLGGGINPDISAARHQTVLLQPGSRLLAGVELSRRYPDARLVFTGGNGDIGGNGVPEADSVEQLWRMLGVATDRMTFERHSRNTWENATMTRDLVTPDAEKRWLLVTSAWHMPRAMGIFRRAGFNVVAFPVDYRTFGTDDDFRWFRGGSEGLTTLDLAVHEWIGLFAYWMHGRSTALFPKP